MSQGVAANDVEQWFLENMASDEPAVPALIEAVGRLNGLGESKKAADLAEMLQDDLAGKGRTEEALQALAARAACKTDSQTFRSGCGKLVLEVLGDDPAHRKLIKGAGFDNDQALDESFRRLQLLRLLVPGVLCFDRTWGFGVIKRMDPFYEQVEIDFERKRDHHLSYAYAAESLKLLDESHLLARRHRDRDGLNQLVAEDPAEVVRITLHSYGPLNAQLLQERITTDLITEAEWKKFWDAARKGLKKDPKVVMPSKRSEPIILLENEMAYDDHWFNQLAGERKMERILEKADELIEESAGELSDRNRDILGDRLSFVVKGAGRRQPGLAARALMDAYELGLDPNQVGGAEQIGIYLEPRAFRAAAADLPARELEPFLRLLSEHQGDLLMDLLLEIVIHLDSSLINHAAALFEEAGRSKEVAAVMMGPLAERKPVPDLMLWIWRNPEQARKWGLWDLPLLVDLTLAAVELEMPPGEIRAQNGLKERFRQQDWLKMVLGELDESARARMLDKVKYSSAWPELDRRSVLGQMIKVCPSLQKVLTGEEQVAEKKSSGPVTSHRSFTARQLKLQKIINEEIPQNSKEIAVARSYGDLRENFEYQAAKDMQGILMRRRVELETMLNTVTPTDFVGFPSEHVGPATEVVLAFDNGRTEEYVILGVWDQDSELGIISSSTQLAEVLQGHSAGERVEVPREEGTEVCLLREVKPLSDDTRAWITAEPSAAEAIVEEE